MVHDYRCRLESDSAGRCPAPAGASGKQGVEGYVVGRFFERIRLASRARENGSAADAEAALVRAARTLEDYVADTDLQATIGYPAYRDGLAARQDEYEDARRKLDAEQAGEVDLPDAETLAGSWDGLAVDERRALLAAALDCVFVRRPAVRGEPLAERLFFCWRGEAPDVPGKGRRDYVPRPFEFDSEGEIGLAVAEDGEPGGGDRLVELAV